MLNPKGLRQRWEGQNDEAASGAGAFAALGPSSNHIGSIVAKGSEGSYDCSSVNASQGQVEFSLLFFEVDNYTHHLDYAPSLRP